MSKNNRILLVVLFVVLIIVLVSIAENSTPKTLESTPAVVALSEPTRLQSLGSTNNTAVRLYFNHPLSSEAADVSLYKIFRPQLCEQQNWHAQLDVTRAELSADGKLITLTTAPQAGVTYLLTINGLYDIEANLVQGSGEGSVSAIFTGTAAAKAIDSDQDGVSDADEQVGWAVRTLSHGNLATCRDVNSDPSQEDTDGDGVADNVEMGYATDPRSPDTDGDDLSDYAEIYTYFSHPLQVDTDQDGLMDGTEAFQLFTSPVLADTDGDGVSDAVEIASGGTNPRLADLPELRLDLYGNPSIILNMTNVLSDTKVSVQTTLEQERTEQVKTDNSSTKMSIENTVSLHTEVEASTGPGGWPPSASAKLTTDTTFKHGYFHEASSNWTNQSVNESKDTFEEKTEGLTKISYDDGMLWVPMKISNDSALTFKVKDLRVIAYRMLPNGSFSAVGTLTPGTKATVDDKDVWEETPLCANPDDASTCGIVLGPGGEIVLVMGADALPAQEMKALVTNPSALMFEVGSYSLFQLDEWGVQETVNFARLGESVIQRTGILVIDFGDGDVQRYMVATNMQRNPDGSGSGVTLAEALKDIIGLADYELCADGKTLCRINQAVTFRCDQETLPPQIPTDFCPPITRPITATQTTTPTITETQPLTTTYIPLGFWMVAGTGPEFEGQNLPNFDEIVLHSGERISLVYLQDSDGDGIFDREEYLLGSDRFSPDSDGDELDDYQETKEGWEVSVQGQATYRVYSDPRYSDADRDFLSDLTEASLGTDPGLANTDGDDILMDSVDPNPVCPPCMDATFLSLTAWWNGSDPAKDLMLGEPRLGIQSNATIVGDKFNNKVSIALAWKDPADTKERVFRFNAADTGQRDQYLQVADTASSHTEIHSEREFTIAAWVFWNGFGSGASQATILAKGPVGSDSNDNLASDDSTATYSLSIVPDGKLKFTIYRYVHEKRWYCYWGRSDWCDDKSRGDDDYNRVEILTSDGVVKPGVWTHVAVTFGGEKMRIYINGQKDKNEFSTASEWWSAWDVKNATWTNWLNSNADPLLIGMDKNVPPIFPFRGTLDDIQFFIRMLQPDEVLQLYNLGVCSP